MQSSPARVPEDTCEEIVVTGKWRGFFRGISMLLVGLTLGLLLGFAWQPPTLSGAAPAGAESGRIWLSVERLEAEQRELKASLAVLRQEVSERQQAVAADTDRLHSLQEELERQRILAGLTPVEGPGVLVVLDDSHASIPLGVDPNLYIVHEYDLRDVVNVLWMAGSEAIAINNERLVSGSSVYCLGSTVIVNDTRLSPPYTIRAIGNPRIQQDYLRNPSYLTGLKEKQRLYGLQFQIEGASTLTLPAFSGGFSHQHASPGG
jgi:uncharacterized protein YlxW (UPF0749 family)